jgi:hypothetical protein
MMGTEHEHWTRNPDGDQPRLDSTTQKGRAIPAQIGFLAENGTPLQVSYQRALELGLVEQQVIPTQSIEKYGKTVVELWNAENNNTG